MCEYIAYCKWMWYHIYTNRCENTMTCMNAIIITHRVRLITDDSRLTVDTVWETHSGKSTTGKGEFLQYSTVCAFFKLNASKPGQNFNLLKHRLW